MWIMPLKCILGVISSRWTLFFSLSLSMVGAETVTRPQKPYLWKAGPWDVCVAISCGSTGTETRKVWCVDAEGLNTHASRCPVAERPAPQRMCVRVCEWHSALYEWNISHWGPCIPISSPASITECVTAQYGLQRRQVTCMRRFNGTAVVSPQSCEAFLPPPGNEQACLLPCPQDCVLSTFSHWSACSRSCGPALQHRTRQVLVAPQYGGADCPSLTQTQSCNQGNAPPCPADQQEHGYSLWVGPWSACRVRGVSAGGRTTVDFNMDSSSRSLTTQSNSTVESYLVRRHAETDRHLSLHHHQYHDGTKTFFEIHIGYQTRQVRCTRNDGKNVMLSLCYHDSPVNFRSCVMPRECELSEWSAWSPCSKTCGAADQSPGYRKRKRSLRGMTLGWVQDCPSLEQREPCNVAGEHLPLCPRYHWLVTNWSECQIIPLIGQHDYHLRNSSFLCGGGIQTRDAYCVQTENNSTPSHKLRPVTRDLCSGTLPSLVQSCSITCPSYCKLSSWSEWGCCIHDNCMESQGNKGFRQRSRTVVGQIEGLTENCPHLLESEPCEDPVCFLWKVTSQGPCIPQDGVCGSGLQEQIATCLNITGEEVPTEWCTRDHPAQALPCVVPCPGDCVLSDWSPWTDCPDLCSSKHSEGRQSRTRLVLALPGMGGKMCPPTPDMVQSRPCKTSACVVFYWHVSPWGPCTPDPLLSITNITNGDSHSTCGFGTQLRRVTCVKVNNGPVSPKRCPDAFRPESVQSCLVPCQTDCIFTPFTEWSLCSSKCRTVNVTASSQSRHRIIIQTAANGGRDCPDTLYEERECDAAPICPTYRWQTHRWQKCILVPGSVRQAVGGSTESCGHGLETREVTCVGTDDVPANIGNCLEWAGPMPARVRPCHVTCRDVCTLSSWSRFSACQACGSWRIRTRSLTGRSKKRLKCQQGALYPLLEREPCPCSEFQSQAQGPWSPCVFPELRGQSSQQAGLGAYLQSLEETSRWRARGGVRECGQGLHYRALACLDYQGRLVNPVLCNNTGLEEEDCYVPCPLDCRLSDWSAWSTCSSSCGWGVRLRSQWLKEKAFNGGRPCPKLDLKNQVSEVSPCYSECDQYFWLPEPWSECTISPVQPLDVVEQEPACGEGVQARSKRCVKRGREQEAVNKSLCGQMESPVTTQSCLLPCPAHCVTSQWGQWSACPMSCDDNAYRWRVRNVLRRPQQGHMCSELNQTAPCVLNSTCFTYSYSNSEWSSCRLNDNAVCGRGYRTRLQICIRSDGKAVDLAFCRERSLGGELQAACEVSCPVNCLLSVWSPWSECSHTCGNQSQMLRSRVVVQEPGEGGQPCPLQLSQTKPCPIMPCYYWLLGDWSPCQIEGADCGDGMKQRNLTCVVHWGALQALSNSAAVEEDKCEKEERREREMELQIPCSVPCPGDCHLTEWSPWSSCQLMCLDGRGFGAQGHQARSRAVVPQVPESQSACPSPVYETRPCKGGVCHSYNWKTSGWRNNERNVWCQRSDGVNVTAGGCSPHNRPSTVRQCHPACTKPFSFCTQSGVCGCDKGFTEVMTSHGFLDYCTRSPGSDHKRADVKTSSGQLRNQRMLRDWVLQPVGPDGRVRPWMYGLMAAAFILILLITAMSFLLCKKTKDSASIEVPQKSLSLAYDGDVDM
ncbi:thrombospondin type-1 domain-containing protein 7B isoform X3 [Denticeps clupeoides]|uniref:thrombospondin type-1 domain-containing protein 7B isoform X3 n=1 Tax=Denticeps clupeoides TaxID=299321 RepID=UPI0010A414DF|nr:thrombospondin type-1 domain-containing protein 7B-like isoform X3 [Denticeps clupeoides]